MASRRVLSSFLRSSARRSPAAWPPLVSPRPPISSPRPSPTGFLLSHAVEYATAAASPVPPSAPPTSPTASATGKITDEYTGKGAIGQVCKVIDAVVDARFDEGLPPITPSHRHAVKPSLILLGVYEQIPQSHLIKLAHAGTQGLPRWFSGFVHGGTATHLSDKIIPQLSNSAEKNLLQTTCNGKEGDCSKVIAFSPLEGSHTKERKSGLGIESSKIKRMELSQKITYALIPSLLLVSKSAATTSLLIFSVYWQIYGFFKEMFLDYVHHEVTRKWVLIYFKLLLLILAKDTILDFDLV